MAGVRECRLSTLNVFGVEPIEVGAGHTPRLEAPDDLADLLESLPHSQGHVVARPGA
jgi:hypothetical protein